MNFARAFGQCALHTFSLNTRPEAGHLIPVFFLKSPFAEAAPVLGVDRGVRGREFLPLRRLARISFCFTNRAPCRLYDSPGSHPGSADFSFADDEERESYMGNKTGCAGCLVVETWFTASFSMGCALNSGTEGPAMSRLPLVFRCVSERLPIAGSFRPISRGAKSEARGGVPIIPVGIIAAPRRVRPAYARYGETFADVAEHNGEWLPRRARGSRIATGLARSVDSPRAPARRNCPRLRFLDTSRRNRRARARPPAFSRPMRRRKRLNSNGPTPISLGRRRDWRSGLRSLRPARSSRSSCGQPGIRRG